MGNIASRISRHFGKTTLALTFNAGTSTGPFQESIAVGSARSVGDLDLCSLLQECRQMLNRFGGHPAAVGLSLSEKNLGSFLPKVSTTTEPPITTSFSTEKSSTVGLVIDAWLNQDEFKPQLGKELLRLSPFGRGNPEPVLGVRNVMPHTAEVFGKKHLKFQFGPKHNSTEVIAGMEKNGLNGWGTRQILLSVPRFMEEI